MESPAETTQDVTPAVLATLLTGAVDVARAAIEEFSGATVGEYLGVTHEDQTSATHRFLAELPGYNGWQWAVVVAAYPGAEHVTISEVVLVPGPTALLAPQWLPWDQRVQPGDLSPGDLLAPPVDDPRLVPGFLLSGDPEIDETAAEIGLGRRQVLGQWGRDEAAQRWHDGDFGPDSAMARSTKRVCRDCGFFLPLAGALGPMFGVCANEMAADGHVVDCTYGCGAHSDTPGSSGAGSPLYDPYDDGVLEVAPNEVSTSGESVSDESVSDESVSEDSAADESGSEVSATDDGAADAGASDEGVSEDGAADEGAPLPS
ncbi:MAG: DUF3027 domain-containing protein [Mycobacterium sp.]